MDLFFALYTFANTSYHLLFVNGDLSLNNKNPYTDSSRVESAVRQNLYNFASIVFPA